MKHICVTKVNKVIIASDSGLLLARPQAKSDPCWIVKSPQYTGGPPVYWGDFGRGDFMFCTALYTATGFKVKYGICSTLA